MSFTTWIRFIPKYFIFFEAIVYMSVDDLFLCHNAEIVCSYVFGVKFLESFIYSNISSENGDSMS